MTSIDDSIEGVLPVDKPCGPSSHDVVATARRALRTRRIGHTGTLDPFASGLLLLCIGRATRIAEYISGTTKRYDAVVVLGAATDTDDLTGTILSECDASGVTRAQVEAALGAQRGRIMQVPPAYSAKKRAGERAYTAARQGRARPLDAVPVTVHEIEITRFDAHVIELNVLVSAGTYIRAIARDLGTALGVGAHLGALRRTAVGSCSVQDALTLDSLTDEAAVQRALIAPLDALGDMPVVWLSADEAAEVRHGRAVAADAPAGTVALAAAGRLLGIATADGSGLVRPKKVLA